MNLRKRFESKYIPEPNSGCWLWTASTHRSGYGQIIECRYGKKRNLRAPRVSWELYRGPIPKGQYVCHKCDLRLCVNPAHLFLGSYSENMMDMDYKGRRKIPAGKRKLLEENVRYILHSKEKGSELARKFHVTEACISLVRNKKNWQQII